MIFFLLGIALFTILFITIDYLLNEFLGKYYLVHSICNFFIVLLTFMDVVNLYINPFSAMVITLSGYASILTYALHFYHIIWYYHKLRFDDWLHHGLMIFIALPIANYFGSVRLLGHSLFYTTGLPGMIDYLLLFLVRNKYIDRLVEKRVNLYLNCYLRNPGCTIHAFLTFINMFMLYNNLNIFFGLITGILVYWNGIYFMEQVIGNYHIERLK